MKEITNRNSKGLLHGYQEWYLNGKLCYKCFFNKNGIKVDYQEHYWLNGELEKTYHI